MILYYRSTNFDTSEYFRFSWNGMWTEATNSRNDSLASEVRAAHRSLSKEREDSNLGAVGIIKRLRQKRKKLKRKERWWNIGEILNLPFSHSCDLILGDRDVPWPHPTWPRATITVPTSSSCWEEGWVIECWKDFRKVVSSGREACCCQDVKKVKGETTSKKVKSLVKEAMWFRQTIRRKLIRIMLLLRKRNHPVRIPTLLH